MSWAGHCMFRALSNQGRGCGGEKAPWRKRRKIRSRLRRALCSIPVFDLSSSIILGEKNLNLAITSSIVTLGRKKKRKALSPSLLLINLTNQNSVLRIVKFPEHITFLLTVTSGTLRTQLHIHMPTSSTLGSITL